MGKPLLEAENLGRNIYVYSNIRTHQTIYSFTPVLHARKAFKQITFVGKKTVPANIRKDLWHPMAMISFPHPRQGQHAFHKLREFKKLHELSWNKEDFKSPKDPRKMATWKERSWKLMNQKANTVADIAAVLKMQEKAAEQLGPVRRELEERKARMLQERREKAMGIPSTSILRMPDHTFVPEGVDGVTIKWNDLLDAEYAEEWPAAVVHDGLPPSRHVMPKIENVPPEEQQAAAEA